ncbi:MAG: C25 family cysteine peptidase [Anaerolineae bacterium]|nr:C25 family cysteine peptidase [Anaerolineae bacterium]
MVAIGPPQIKASANDQGSSIVIEWTPPQVEIQLQPDGTVQLKAGNYPVIEQPGLPRLPYTSTLLAVPPGVTPSLRILSSEFITRTLPGSLPVAPKPDRVLLDQAGFPETFLFETTKPLPLPPAPIVLENLGIMRGVRLARLTFYPALPYDNHLQIYRFIRAEVIWEGKLLYPLKTPADDPILKAIPRAVLNPQDVVPAFPPARITGTEIQLRSRSPEAFLEISHPGLYRLKYEDLQPFGFAEVNPANLRLFQGNKEVAYEWEGDNDAIFEPGESILFYAEPRFSRWTSKDVYRLEAGETPGFTIASRPASPANMPMGTVWVEETFEKNQLYMPDRFTPGIPVARNGDRWTWDYLVGPGTNPVNYPFFLPAVNSNHPATLIIWAIGHTSGEHRWNISLNGTAIGQITWNGKTSITATLPISPSILRNRDNILSITPQSHSGAWLDAFAIHYARSLEPFGNTVIFGSPILSPGGTPPFMPHKIYIPLVLRNFTASGQAYSIALEAPGPYRAYDITDPFRPVRLTDFQVNGHRITLAGPPGGTPYRYLIASEGAIRTPDRIRLRESLWSFPTSGEITGADYLIITHPAFADALSPLIELRRTQGLTVAVVNVLGIYDAYGDGRPDPETIRRFIADAYRNWSPRPVYILLVGDGSYDPRQYRPESPPTFIPPYLADVDPWGGETAADNRYACVDGNDNLPDLLIGRLPVKSPGDARAVLQKIVDYETRPFPGGWNSNVLLVADDPDPAGDFHAFSDNAATWVKAPFTVTRRYCPRGTCSSEAPALRSAILNDWNRGTFLIQYFGHSSWHQWAIEQIFHLSDLSTLRNFRRYPILAEMTCFTSAFHRPEPTLDEELILRPDSGAVTSWGPTGLSLGAGHKLLSEGFFRAVFREMVSTIGEATLAGKLNLLPTRTYQDMLDTYTLLGDPALRWNRTIVPWKEANYLPLVMRNHTGTR